MALALTINLIEPAHPPYRSFLSDLVADKSRPACQMLVFMKEYSMEATYDMLESGSMIQRPREVFFSPFLTFGCVYLTIYLDYSLLVQSQLLYF